MTDTIRFDDPGELPTLLTRLPVEPGDILVVSGFPDDMRENITETVMDHYANVARARLQTDPSLPDAASYHCPMIVFLQPGVTIDALDEEDMRAAGWIRAERVFRAP